MRTLIIDNYDSFTFNLFQMIAAVNGEEPIVVRNDQIAWEALQRQAFDNIVISPGPGTVENEADFGICRAALLAAPVPILGVCLGHQGIGHLYGGRVRHAAEPMHGRLSAVFHDGSELFAGIPQGFKVVRYHSLLVDNALPAGLQRTAWTADDVMMAMRHRTLPIWGVQFHPESICTEYGDQLLRNFRDLTHRSAKPRSTVAAPEARLSVVPVATRSGTEPAGFAVKVRKLAILPDAHRVYGDLFEGHDNSFWLDSSRSKAGVSRFSFMGDATGPHSAVVSYNATTGEVTQTRGGAVQRFDESIYTYLERALRERRCLNDELPFDFNCGFVGYFGYELKREAGASHRHPSDYADAMFLLADRLIAFDHEEKATYLLCLTAPGAGEDATTQAWFDDTERQLRAERTSGSRGPALGERPIAFRLSRPYRTYLADIERCKALIRDGESYEICLTNQIHTSTLPDPLSLYLTLRRINPAPYSTFLRSGGVSIMSSSPERFLRIDRTGQVESKPIKGTRPRGNTPAEDRALAEDLRSNEKDRSENLMIVDLLRNDLGIVCEIGSVHVPELMEVETYETVHQLVSTVRGQLRQGLSAIDCVRHAFPGGSMTGAPKLRAMNIIDELETEPRGVYSGSIGFLGLNGTADLNIVIRTLVETAGSTTIGVGGAIIMLSDAEAEFEETMLKAKALIHAVVLTSRGSVDPAAYEAAMTELRETGQTIF
jgi:para-aminobenzoate synthetase